MDTDMTVEGVEQILEGFSRLSGSIQKKYLGAAVREAAKDEIPEIKALTPRGPTGNLRRSVGVKVEKKKRNATAVGILGYRSKLGGNNSEKGFHAWWVENGTKYRQPNNWVLKVPLANASKYPYLRGKVARIGGSEGGMIFFGQVKGMPKSDKFKRWADANLPQIKQRLIGKLGDSLGKAISEAERQAIRKMYGKK
jgi:hypothetical protein